MVELAMRKALVAGNWKMNGNAQFAADLGSQILAACKTEMFASSGVDVVMCPPSPYLGQLISLCHKSSKSVSVAAQNVSEHANGAYTGEISVAMLADLGVAYCLVGHSERRQLFAETNEQVAAKAVALLEQNIAPIVCVGETQQQRQADQTFAVIESQIQSLLQAVPSAQMSRVIIAYEPVWAIGTGLTATPEQAQAVHAAIREQFRQYEAAVADTLRILYGGSVKPDNATELFSQVDIDGGLIGGASLKAESFIAICQAARQ